MLLSYIHEESWLQGDVAGACLSQPSFLGWRLLLCFSFDPLGASYSSIGAAFNASMLNLTAF